MARCGLLAAFLFFAGAAYSQSTAPSAAEQARILAGIKEYALNYIQSLPNYVCVQNTRRRITALSASSNSYGAIRLGEDNVRELLTFSDRKESYKIETVNGRPAGAIEHSRLAGVVSSGEFGTMLGRIFDADAGTTFDWEQLATLRGKRVDVFAFRVPQKKGYSLYHGRSKREYVSAYDGLIYADRDKRAIMRIKMDCNGIPKDFPIQGVGLILDYNPTKISGHEYMLPFHFELHSIQDGAFTTNEANYTQYRKFGVEATLEFGQADVPENPGREHK